ncbi:hypothetical protein [Sphingomonas sp. PWP1-2]|uniref:hypothetical protein n=1 Tax=Sphingomonas sp. PWP1-2 TaxID=2804558 RepID=UPI003CF04986
MMIWMLLLAQAGAVGASPPVAGLELHLVCRGVGERKVVNGASAVGFGSNGNTFSAFGTRTSHKDFEDQFDFNLVGGVGTARVPRRFLPPAHGGDGGWFNVKDMVVGDDYITGKVMINLINHPNIRLDRRTGTVSLGGKVGSYSGECQKVDPTAHAF